MTVITPTRMVFGYDNYLRYDYILGSTPVQLVNCSAASGSNVNNLLYEDTTIRLVTTQPSADPEIIYDGGAVYSSLEHVVFGFVDWTEPFRYQEIELFAGATVSGPWFTMLNTTIDGAITQGDNRKTVLWNFSGSQVPYWRIQLRKTAAGPYYALDIANFVMFRGFELAQNPDRRGVVRNRNYASRIRRAAGGAPHIARTGGGATELIQYRWSRMDKSSFKIFEYAQRDYRDYWIGTIPPQEAGGLWPDADCPVGRMVGLSSNADVGVDRASHVYGAALTMEGVF